MRTARLALGMLVAQLCLACGQPRAHQGVGPADTNAGDESSRAAMRQPLELHRIGGIAGFDDRLTVTSEGMATLTTRDGRIRSCALPADLVTRSRSITWDALPSAAPPSGRSDVMRYVVKTGERTTVLDADVPPPAQAGAVDTAAALFAAAADCPPAS